MPLLPIPPAFTPASAPASVTALATSLVTGFSESDRMALVGGWLARKPPAQRWAVLFNGAQPPAIEPALLPEAARAQVAGGCACCAARIAFGVSLDRLLRRAAWDRLLVVLDAGGHAAGTVDLLRSGANAGRLRLDEVLAVVDPVAFEARLDDSKQALAIAQFESADRLVIPVALAAGGSAGAAAAARLAVREPFFRRVEIVPPGAAALPGDRLPAWPDRFPSGDGESRRWDWPPGQCFDRASLVRASAHWVKLPGLVRARGVFRTARDTVLWRIERGSAGIWQSSGWRRDSRLELGFAPGIEPDPPGIAALEASIREAMRPSAAPSGCRAGTPPA
jgi:hypothetical protein